jgi:hypothetical protein
MRKLMLSCAMLVGLSGVGYARDQIEVVKGQCVQPGSHTAEGALGEDLTKRESMYYCNLAAITFFGDYIGHVLVQFSQANSHHPQILGFAGRLAPDGIKVQVEHVYLAVGQKTTVSDGYCELSFKDRHMTDILCAMKVDETGLRTVAIVLFKADPGQ